MKFELISYMGDTNHIAHCARQSFGKKSEDYTDEQNNKLVGYLAREGHIKPFAHVQICCAVEAPIFLMRQWSQSAVGAVYSELSRRYVDTEPTFWQPNEWRQRPEKGIKQGSGKTCEDQSHPEWLYDIAIRRSEESYEELLNSGVAPELARAVLPQGMYTNVIITGSLLYWSRLFNLRSHNHAQKDWKFYTDSINYVMKEIAPEAWKELT